MASSAWVVAPLSRNITPSWISGVISFSLTGSDQLQAVRSERTLVLLI